MRIGAVRADLRRGDRARRGVVGEQQIGARFEQRKAAGDRLARQRERIFARGVEDDDGGFQAERGQGFQIVRQARGAQANVGVAGDGRIHGNEIILAVKLESQPREIDESHGFRSRSAGLVQKIAQGAAQPVFVEVARAGHVEARRLQGLCDQPGVIGGGRERMLFIAGLADHQRDALFRGESGSAAEPAKQPDE